jgi:hypothetical protein
MTQEELKELIERLKVWRDEFARYFDKLCTTDDEGNYLYPTERIFANCEYHALDALYKQAVNYQRSFDLEARKQINSALKELDHDKC